MQPEWDIPRATRFATRSALVLGVELVGNGLSRRSVVPHRSSSTPVHIRDVSLSEDDIRFSNPACNGEHRSFKCKKSLDCSSR